MFELLWLVPLFPFLGAAVLALSGSRMKKPLPGIIGSASVGISALISIMIGINYISSPPPNGAVTQTLWTWFDIAGFVPKISFYLDAMTVVFIFVITFVGFLIHVYSVEYMNDEEGFSRFFAYMNLFVGSMLTLVLADNLLLLYLGWEGVGLCSYLLIGFFYKHPANNTAARKAFIVTRIGDTAMSIGLFMLVLNFSTLDIQEILSKAPIFWSVGSKPAAAIALLLLGGALGKSAQLPLQTWLPDAMAGPTPVSALIHAATMVTAGVYLIARTHVLYSLAPNVQLLIAVIGAATLLLAGFSALVQTDLKRVLAYSTISQIGYMFLALGVGAWSAGVFHFMIHAFFKALLFLGAGAVILSLHHEQNMNKMGGLSKELPVIFKTFIAGSAALAALPFVTAGFYSKDLILGYAWTADNGSPWLWAAGLAGALLTSLYTTRMVVLTFFGKMKTHVHYHPTNIIKVPLIILAVLSIIGGFIELPHLFGHFTLFSDFMERSLPAVSVAVESTGLEIFLMLSAAAVSIGGVYLGYILYYKNPETVSRFEKTETGSFLTKTWYSGWGFDKLYDWVFVLPFVTITNANKGDFFDLIYKGIALLSVYLNKGLSLTQSGKLRWYALGIVIGAVITLTIVVFL
jgi:NADH-quinone oxidoreductase subunit L